MNKHIRIAAAVTIALFLPIAASTRASAQRMELGLHAGADIAMNNGSADVSAAVRNGVLIGASLAIPLAPSVQISIGAQYAHKSVRLGVAPAFSSGTASPAATLYTTNYLELPVHLRFGVGSAFKVFVSGGTNVSTLLSAANEASGSETGGTSVDLSSVSIALEAGGGMSYEVAPGISTGIDAQYTFALIQQRGTAPTLLQPASWTPRALKITGGISFAL